MPDADPMRQLFFTNTPAHVHLYKHAVEELRERGHDARILARDYGCTTDLLDWYDLPYTTYGRCDTSKYSLLRNLPSHYRNILTSAVRFDPDLLFGMGAYSAHAGAVSRSPVVLILDSEPTSLDHKISKPFADAMLTPAAFQKDLGENHYEFPGFKECAYLHPDVYEPAGDVRDSLGLDPDERFVLVRFNAFGSHHDVGEGGFDPAQRRTLVEELAAEATVLLSDEGNDTDTETLPARSFDLHPALLHDALAEADLLVADTQTMVTEAALLGTPAVRSNSFVGQDDMGNFIELEERGLVQNRRAFDEVLDAATDLLADPTATSRWERRREAFMSETVNLTDVIVDVAVDPDSIEAKTEMIGRRESDMSRLTEASADITKP